MSTYANNMHIIVTLTKCTVKYVSEDRCALFFDCIDCRTYVNRSFGRSLVRSFFQSLVVLSFGRSVVRSFFLSFFLSFFQPNALSNVCQRRHMCTTLTVLTVARMSVSRSVVRSFANSVFLSFFPSQKSHILWPEATSVSHAYSILRHKTMYFGVCNNVLWVKTAICR